MSSDPKATLHSITTDTSSRRPLRGDGQPGTMNHIVQFYEDDAFLCDTVARFIGAGLATGEPVVIIATDLHRHGFVQRLKSNGFDVDRIVDGGRLMLLDARQTLAQFMVGDMPDWDRFVAVIGEVLAATSNGHAHARAYGEMVDLLWRDGNTRAAIRLEEMWNDLGKRYDFSLLCAYVMGNFYREADRSAFVEVCQVHSHVTPAEGYSQLEDANARMREVSLLQQRARALENEIAQRRHAEECLARLVDEQTRRGDQSEERFRLLVESVSDHAIFMLDPEGHIVTWNVGAQRIKGYRADEIIGQHFSRFYPDEEVRAGKCEYELAVASRQGRFEEEGWRVRKDGSCFWANVVISRVVDATGKLVGFAKVTRDLTQRRQLESEKLARVAAEAQLAEKARSEELREQLVGIVGHDLRTPLAAIVTGLAVMLRRGNLTDADMRTAARVAKSAERMTAMIGQLLDFTRARLGGGFAIERAELELAELCREVIAEVAIVHPDRVRLVADGDTRGRWDRDRLAQVVQNLVGNAIQHGAPESAVEVRVADDGERVCLTVHNDGPAIPDAILPAIFEPFRRGSGKRDSSKTESLGLGLYISHELVAAHGGEISVRSTEQEGTTFAVRLPR
jgi:PAS domain S-box-containing protein